MKNVMKRSKFLKNLNTIYGIAVINMYNICLSICIILTYELYRDVPNLKKYLTSSYKRLYYHKVVNRSDGN